MSGHLGIRLGPAELELHPEGVAFWRERGWLLVADLHLETGICGRRRGRPLPDLDTAATLDRLERVVARLAPGTIVSLGDAFHDGSDAARLPAAVLRRIRGLGAWIWIGGNHDPEVSPQLPGERAGELRTGGLRLAHRPDSGACPEIFGHFHPVVALGRHGRRIARRCFVTDGTRLLLPAFGAWTGGLGADAAPVRELFDPFRAEVCLPVRGRVRRLRLAALSGDGRGGATRRPASP